MLGLCDLRRYDSGEHATAALDITGVNVELYLLLRMRSKKWNGGDFMMQVSYRSGKSQQHGSLSKHWQTLGSLFAFYSPFPRLRHTGNLSPSHSFMELSFTFLSKSTLKETHISPFLSPIFELWSLLFHSSKIFPAGFHFLKPSCFYQDTADHRS